MIDERTLKEIFQEDKKEKIPIFWPFIPKKDILKEIEDTLSGRWLGQLLQDSTGQSSPADDGCPAFRYVANPQGHTGCA